MAAPHKILSLVVSVLFLSACASKQQLPPGDDLEMPDQEGGGGSRQSTPPPVDPEQKAFEDAFDQKDPPPQQTVATPMPEGEKVVDERAEASKQYVELARQVKAKGKEGKWDEVTPLLEPMRAAAKKVGPDLVEASWKETYRVTVAQKDYSTAEKIAKEWLHSCGGDSVYLCRRDVTVALSRLPNPSAALKKRLETLREQDECVRQADAAAASRDNGVPPCTDAAIAFYKRDGDKLMVARIQLARAYVALNDSPPSNSAFALLERAEKTCDEPRCLSVRRRALKGELRLARATNDVEGAAKAALREMELYSTLLPAEQRLWAWTPEVEAACTALDAKNGAGSCRRLEKQLTGTHHYKDFSKQIAKGEGLPPEKVKEVNAHYAASLEECLNDAAARLTPPASESHGVHWVVGNEGKVVQVEMTRKTEAQTPLAQCLRQQFVAWRYPKYRGELQHVEQTFMVHARERR